MVLTKLCTSDLGKPFSLTVDAYEESITVLSGLGFVSEHEVALAERKEKNTQALKSLVENAPRIDKQCETCKVIFHPTIYQKKPKYCSRACFFKRNA